MYNFENSENPFIIYDPICSVGNGIDVSLLTCNPCGAKHPTLFCVAESVTCVTILSISFTSTSLSAASLSKCTSIRSFYELLFALVGWCCQIEELFWAHHLHWVPCDLGLQEVWSKCIQGDGWQSPLRLFGTRNRRNQVLYKLRIFLNVRDLQWSKYIFQFCLLRPSIWLLMLDD